MPPSLAPMTSTATTAAAVPTTNNNNSNEKTNDQSSSSSSTQSRSRPVRRMRRVYAASVSPGTKRRRLLEDHYRVDPGKKVILPGVPKHEDDWARDVHDFFNLIVLVRNKKREKERYLCDREREFIGLTHQPFIPKITTTTGSGRCVECDELELGHVVGYASQQDYQGRVDG